MKAILAASLIASLFAARTLAQENLTCGYTQYDPSEYTCEYGELVPIESPLLEGFFGVKAANPTAPFDGEYFQACNGSFFLGLDKPCFSCHPRLPGTCSTVNATYFRDETNLLVSSPGRQPYYVESNGALRYGYPIPDDALVGSTAYANGTFTYDGFGWLACPIDGAGPGQRYRVFVQLPGLFFIAICFPFEAIATPYESGKIPFIFSSRPWEERKDQS